VLAETAQQVTNNLRKIDFFGRYGGEEFLIILPGTSAIGATLVGERICNDIYQLPLYDKETAREISISISAGVSSSKPRSNIETILLQADQALYRAKARGKNRVICFG